MLHVKAIKNTFDSKETLKENGFVWNKDNKTWERDFESKEEYNKFMEHFLNPTYYGRKVVNKYHSQVVFEIEEDTEEVETMVEELNNNNIVATFNADPFSVESEEQLKEVINALGNTSRRYDIESEEFSELAEKLDGGTETFKSIYANNKVIVGVLR